MGSYGWRHTIVVTLLKGLFVGLACEETPAVLPEVELAKLALTTSKDDEESDEMRLDHDNDANGTSTSGTADTDSTLVESVAPTGPQVQLERIPFLTPAESSSESDAQSAQPPSSTVLGKRASEDDIESGRGDRKSPMEIDPASDPILSPQSVPLEENHPQDQDGDIEMENAPAGDNDKPPPLLPVGPAAPPLPPRRAQTVGEMMFGMMMFYSSTAYCFSLGAYNR